VLLRQGYGLQKPSAYFDDSVSNEPLQKKVGVPCVGAPDVLKVKPPV
jgi:hypothetical protein